MNRETQDGKTQDTREEARERHMIHLYGYICRQSDQAAAIASLEDYALRELNGYLARLNLENGFPGMIRGLVICEACERFMNIEHSTSNIQHRSEEGAPRCGCNGCKEWREGGHA